MARPLSSILVAASGVAMVTGVQLLQQLQLDSDMLLESGEHQATCQEGCACTRDSHCRPEDGASPLTDRCYTDCGWANCSYPPDSTFDMLNYTAKTAAWWDKITKNSTRADFPSGAPIMAEDMKTSFANMKDEMPAGRLKTSHTVGSICKFQIDISEDSYYTGLLGPGIQEGLIRLGGSVDPTLFGGGLTPGLGLKFARTGVPSGHLLTLHTFDFFRPEKDWNFFKWNQSNIVPPFPEELKFLRDHFRTASQCANKNGVSDLARYSQDGRKHDEPKFPFKLLLVPNDAIRTDLPGEENQTLDKVHEVIDAIEINTVLYSMYACDKPSQNEMRPTESMESCGSPMKLGDIVTTSRCTTSSYGDEKLFFRHQRIEEDWELRPDFMNYEDAARVCGCDEGTELSVEPKSDMLNCGESP